jgi:hypothetical protein
LDEVTIRDREDYCDQPVNPDKKEGVFTVLEEEKTEHVAARQLYQQFSRAG